PPGTVAAYHLRSPPRCAAGYGQYPAEDAYRAECPGRYRWRPEGAGTRAGVGAYLRRRSETHPPGRLGRPRPWWIARQGPERSNRYREARRWSIVIRGLAGRRPPGRHPLAPWCLEAG